MVNVSQCCWVRDNIPCSTIVSPLDAVIWVAWCCMFLSWFISRYATKPSTWSSSVLACCSSMILFPSWFYVLGLKPWVSKAPILLPSVRFWAIKQGDVVPEDILDRDTSDDESLPERPAWSPWWWINGYDSSLYDNIITVIYLFLLPVFLWKQSCLQCIDPKSFWTPKNFGYKFVKVFLFFVYISKMIK